MILRLNSVVGFAEPALPLIGHTPEEMDGGRLRVREEALMTYSESMVNDDDHWEMEPEQISSEKNIYPLILDSSNHGD